MYLLFIKRISFFLSFFILTISLNAQNNQTISIQLKWKHSFQFAGYYAALEKGFYKEEGLNVNLLEINFKKPYVNEVLSNNVQYGVSDTSIVIPKIQGKGVVLVSQIFQHSPLVLISRRDSDIRTPYDLTNKKVMYSFKNTGGVPFRALILKTLGSFDNIDIQNFTSYNDFINKKVDVISAYSTSQPYWLKKQGIEVNIIDPKSYGIDFYGDCLFTNKQELKNHPLRVAKVKRATIKGWEYALNHQDEIIDLIIKKYTPNKSKDELKYEAKGIYQMILPDLVDIGTIDKNRYIQVIKLYFQLGLIKNKELNDDFIYKDKKELLFTKKEKKWLKENSMIRIALMNYWKYDKNGNNIHTDILRLLNKYGHIGLKTIKFDRWEDGINQASSGENIHGISNLSWSKEREKNDFLYTKAYDFTPHYLVVKKENNNIKSLKDLENKVIFLKKKSITHAIINREVKSIKIINLDTNKEMYKRLSSSNKAIAFLSYRVDKDKLKKYNLKVVKKIYNKYSKIHIGISHKYPELQSIINKIYHIIPRKELIKLQNKIYSFQNIYLTKEEKLWLLNNPIINFNLKLQREPLEFISNKTKQYSGIANDYLELISKKMGIDFKLNNKESNKYSFYPCISKSKELSKKMYFTNSYLEYPIIMVTKIDKEFLPDLESLNKKTIVTVKGHFINSIIENNYIDINIIYANTVKEALQNVSTGKAYTFVSTLPIASYAINKYAYSDLKIAGKTKYKIKLRMAINKEIGKVGISILNKALKEISKEEKNKIYNKWLSIKFEESINYTILWQLSGFFIFFILGTLYWNRKLSLEIKKTKQREEELKIANVKAHEASKSKSEFLANMSHEIRTPMNSIIGFSDLLSKIIKDPIQKDYLHSIQTGGKALMVIINDILDLSKIEAGKFQIEKESINPRNLFLEMKTIFNAKINQKNLSFIIDIDDSLPEAIIVDSVRIRQILLNLIGNAIKFTNRGKIILKIENTFKNNINSKIDLKISVIDTGRGIAKEFQEIIFHAFEQTSVEDAKAFAGTGLGLAICSKLTRLMNGTIEVQSEIQKGSSFIINLHDIDVGSLIIDKQNIKIPEIKFNNANILVVDDVLDNRKLVTATLNNDSFSFTEAKNGKEAVDIMNNTSNTIDLILMDLRMPIMNGYEATAKIKEYNKSIPIIAFTASVMNKELEQIKEYQFDGYIRKPVIYDNLIKELMKHLSYVEVEVKKDHIENKNITKNIINNIPKVLNKLENEFKLTLDKIKDKGDFSLIEELMNQIHKIAIENEVSILENYTSDILLAIESFDIDKVTTMINKYDIICNILRKLYEDNQNV